MNATGVQADVITRNWSSKLCNCWAANERRMHQRRVGAVTSQCTHPRSPRRERAPPRSHRVRQCVLKMADGLCTGDPIGDVIEKTTMKDFANVMICETNDSVNDVPCEKVNSFYITSASDKLFNKLCDNDGSKHEGFLPCEDDCRKKRCVDRYDSSESSDRWVYCLFITNILSKSGVPFSYGNLGGFAMLTRSLSWPLP